MIKHKMRLQNFCLDTNFVSYERLKNALANVLLFGGWNVNKKFHCAFPPLGFLEWSFFFVTEKNLVTQIDRKGRRHLLCNNIEQ